MRCPKLKYMYIGAEQSLAKLVNVLLLNWSSIEDFITLLGNAFHLPTLLWHLG